MLCYTFGPPATASHGRHQALLILEGLSVALLGPFVCKRRCPPATEARLDGRIVTVVTFSRRGAVSVLVVEQGTQQDRVCLDFGIKLSEVDTRQAVNVYK